MMPAMARGLNPPIGGHRSEQAIPLSSVRTRPPWRSRGIILRPRLDAFLDIIRHRLLTTLIAPPGYGKTTVALSWVDALAGSGGRVAWLSLATEDNEPERFLDYLEAAVAPVCAKQAVFGAAALSAAFSVPIETRLGWLLEELGGLIENVFLFLDDFHLMSHPRTIQAISFLLRNAPQNLRVVILSRENLGLGLDQLRARDNIFEIDACALLFDARETDQLLQKGEFAHSVSEEGPALQALTGGWIAALRAAVATLRSHGNPEQYLRKLPTILRPISSLFGDLLDGLPSEIVGFLERVSITERQCAGLAGALASVSNAQAMLEQLERQHLFIARQDDRGSWFVFHPLFREFLECRVQARSGVDVPGLHQLASDWFAKQGLWTEAIHHALIAGDVAQAVGWIETHAMILVGDGDILTLLSWERQLSAHLVASPIRLRLAFSWALCLAMASERALVLLDGVEAELESQADGLERNNLQRECRALRAVLLAEKGDYEAASVLANQYLCQPAVQPWVPNAILNVIASAHLHTGRWEQLYGVPPLAHDSNATRMRDRTSMVYRLCILGLAEYHQGHLDDAARYLEDAQALGAALGVRGKVLQALPAPTLAMVRYEQGRLDEAKRINTEHFEINRRVGPIDGLSGCYRLAARLARMQGQPLRARGLLDDAEQIANARGWNQVTACICLEKIRYALIDGRVPEAAAGIVRLEQLVAASDKHGAEHEAVKRDAALAKAWRQLVELSPQDAAVSLDAQLVIARADGRQLDELSIGTALAMAWFKLGRHAQVVPLIFELCRKAMGIGARRSMLDQVTATDALMVFALEQARNADESIELIAFIQSLVVTQIEPSDGVRPTSLETDTLSPREHRILKLISDGLSNKEIARNLGVTAETVKSHLKKIYPKLGVQNRAQAAARLG